MAADQNDTAWIGEIRLEIARWGGLLRYSATILTLISPTIDKKKGNVMIRPTRARILITATALLSLTGAFSLAADSLPSHAQSASHMTAAAKALIATLDTDQRESTVLPLLVDERTTWSNLPIIMVSPKGILVGDMNDDQRLALHDLLRASMSSQGYGKAAGIMRLDDLLYEIDSARLVNDPEWRDDPFRKAFVTTRSSGNYADRGRTLCRLDGAAA
jgi:hypothetical protein